jgi:3-oxoacyl-[acyl-carrier protein] reductase
MDMGIAGRLALVCGASAGLGRACAEALAAEGADLAIVARDAARLEAAAGEIRARHGVQVRAICADVTLASGQARILTEAAEPDILINNSGGPPPGDIDAHDWEAWADALRAQLTAPVQLTRALVPGMRARRFGRIVNVTSAMVKSPASGMILSAAARTGLTSAMKGLSHETASDNVTVNALLPFLFDTGRQVQMTRRAAERTGKTVEQVRAERAGRIAAGRFGRAEEFGAACAFLCSAHAGYISGQSILMDGGTFTGLL